jgi:hypothetical protein
MFCLYVCVYIYIYIYTHTHIYIYIYIYIPLTENSNLPQIHAGTQLSIDIAVDRFHLSSEYRHLLTWPLTDGIGSNGRKFWCEVVINFRWPTAHQYNHEEEEEQEQEQEEQEQEEEEEEEEEMCFEK